MSNFLVILLLCFTASITALEDETTKYVILDTDMGADDAWALQMLLNAEKQNKNIKLLAITTVDGVTEVNNVIKNTYHILDGLNRTDVRMNTSIKIIWASKLFAPMIP